MASTNLNNAINRIETAVDSQAELLAQLSSILDGKAGGGSGGSVETCTVTITLSGLDITNYCATVFTGDSIVHNTVFTGTSGTFTIENAVCGSPIILMRYSLLDTANGLTVYTLSSNIQLIGTDQLCGVLVPHGDSTVTVTYD